MSPQPPRQTYGQRRTTSSWDETSSTDLMPRVNVGMVVMVAIGFSVLTVVALHFLVRGGGLGAAPGIQVPEVVGMTRQQARLSAENAGLSLRVIGEVADPFVAPGSVARQVPLAGQKAEAGTTLAVTLSKSAAKQVDVPPTPPPPAGGTQIPAPTPPTQPEGSNPIPKTAAGSVSVPKVKGVRLKFARGRLSQAGLSVGRLTYANDEDHMEGYVLRQSPAPGTQVPRGSTVALTVNRTD